MHENEMRKSWQIAMNSCTHSKLSSLYFGVFSLPKHRLWWGHQFRNHMNIYEHPWKSVKIHGHVDENRLHKPLFAGFIHHFLLDNRLHIQPRATRPFSSVRAMERCRSKALEAWHSPPAFGGDRNVTNHPPVITIFMGYKPSIWWVVFMTLLYPHWGVKQPKNVDWSNNKWWTTHQKMVG